MTWQDLKPLYFSALNLSDDATRQALPDFEQRVETAAKLVLQKLDDGTLMDEETEEAGLTLFYQACLLQGGQQALEDGYLQAKDLLRPQRYASGGDDTAEEVARLMRSTQLLMHAIELRPDDTRVPMLGLSARYNRESLDGTHSPALQLDMLTAARTDSFSLLSTLILWRDNDVNPGNAAHMEQLLTTVCAPDHYDCEHPPSAPPRSPDGERKLTQEVNGPVLVSDLLTRRAEALLGVSDAAPDPMTRAPLLSEAQSRLQFAQGTLGFAVANANDPALSQYPAKDHLGPRTDRINQLLAAIPARMAGMADPPALPDSTFYTSRDYRAAYQCVACHTKGTTTMDFPR
jgi:hypothetical protein